LPVGSPSDPIQLSASFDDDSNGLSM
jgi:hypothetical protein